MVFRKVTATLQPWGRLEDHTYELRLDIETLPPRRSFSRTEIFDEDHLTALADRIFDKIKEELFADLSGGK